MIQFIKDAFTELEHIVWPTPNESRKYMLYTIGTIVVISLFLAATGYLIRTGLVLTREQFPHSGLPTTVSGEEAATQQDLQNILDQVQVDNQPIETPVSTGVLTPDTSLSGAAQ